MEPTTTAIPTSQIDGLWPSRQYALRLGPFPARNSATIKLTHFRGRAAARLVLSDRPALDSLQNMDSSAAFLESWRGLSGARSMPLRSERQHCGRTGDQAG
jgi:hypothetical protein